MIVLKLKMVGGGHRFIFSCQGNKTKIDHELIMNPIGVFLLLAPMINIAGKKNLNDTTNALQKYLEKR
jgi:hypothetical protein